MAKPALLVAAVGHLRGNSDVLVNPDSARLKLRRDAVGAEDIARPDGGRQTIVAVVGKSYALLFAFEGQHAEHWPENLLLHHLVALADGEDNRRLLVKAVVELGLGRAFAARHDLRTSR